MAKHALPEGHHTITPGMIVHGAARLIDFLEKVFGGKVVDRYDGPEGQVMHAEVRIGDSVVMMGEPTPEFPPRPAMLSVYVDDVDDTYQRAIAAGARSLQEPSNQFYGHRTARIEDPSGNQWSISAVIESLSREEIERRMAQIKPR